MPRLARSAPKELADKYDEVVAAGPVDLPRPADGPPAAPDAEAAGAGLDLDIGGQDDDDGYEDNAADAVLAVQQAFDELRNDLRTGLAAAAEAQASVLREELAQERREREALRADLLVAIDTVRQELASVRVAAAAPTGASAEVVHAVTSVKDDVAARAGELEAFLRTATTGANRWFVGMRDDLYQRMDQFDQSGKPIATAIAALRADVKDLHAILQRLQEERSGPPPKGH